MSLDTTVSLDPSWVRVAGVYAPPWRFRKPAQAQPGAAPTPRQEFAGEFLHAWTREERVRSHQPVTLRRGSDTFTGDSLEYDHLAQVLELRGRVRGSLAAPAARH